MQIWKLGCRWGGGTPLFYNFIKEHDIVIGWVDKDYQIGDWLFITDGHTVLSFAKVLENRKSILDFPEWEEQFKSLEIPFEKDLYIYRAKFINLKKTDQFSYPLQQGIIKVKGEEYIQNFIKLRTKYLAQEYLNQHQHLSLLLYKKQIILQGPPGTGKTKLAKEIALDIIDFAENQSYESLSSLSINEIKRLVIPGITINSSTNYTEYLIQEVGDNNITVKLKNQETEYKPSYEEIIKAYETKMWDGKIIKGNDTYAAAIAKYIFSKLKERANKLEDNDQFKFVQFHPSYSYEDFVRGIVAKPNPDGEGILYEAENRIIGSFAKQALENYQISNESKEKSTQILQTKTTFQRFVEYVADELDKTEDRKYQISDAVYLFDVDDKRFKYKGDKWKAHEKGLNMKYSELEKIIQSGITQRSEIKNQINLESLTKQHATYFFNTLKKYREFEKTHLADLSPLEIEQQIKERNYVLVIDEINRANLSSVLGELIYALEYRGKAVECMYAIDGSKEIILPPNLYIIGTMNTADRSVGHIDYAIRRRFAFVDVLPKDLANNAEIKFHSDLFKKVSAMFISNYEAYVKDNDIQIQRAPTLSPEFDPKDVWLGHSYFIDKLDEGASIEIRLQYEIKPILNEYVKDGILIGDDILKTIANLSA